MNDEKLWDFTVLESVTEAPIRNRFGDFLSAAFVTVSSGQTTEHLVLYKSLSNTAQDAILPVRIQSACVTGEVFGADGCDCKWQLEKSLRYIVSVGAGILIYYPGQEGRGYGLIPKLKLHKLIDTGLSLGKALDRLGISEDQRRFNSSAVILRHFGVTRVNLLTNNPKKIETLRALGIEVARVTPLVMATDNVELRKYLRSKRDELGHLIPRGV